MEKLKEQKIGTSVHYIPIHHHPYYKRVLNINPDELAITDEIFRGLVSLPLYSKMTIADVTRVISRVNQIINSSVCVMKG